ncbi:MAG: ABC-type Fe3+-hydroxamate transport system substrate-binding protein [Planctomycetota bacterium]
MTALEDQKANWLHRTAMKRIQTTLTIAGLLVFALVAIMKLRDVPEPGDLPPTSGEHRILATSSDQIDLLSLFLTPNALVAVPVQALKYSRVAMTDPRYAKLPTFDRFVAETALQWEPSLVIVSPFVPVDTQAQLRRFGTPLLFLDPRDNWDGLKQSIISLGKALGKIDVAKKIIEKQESRLQQLDVRVQEVTLNKPHRRFVSYANYGSGGWGAGPGLSIDWVIKTAGLENAASDLNRNGAFAMSFEDLVVLDPDYIIISEGQDGSKSSTEKTLLSSPDLALLSAIKHKRFIRMPSNIMSASSQEMISASELLLDLWQAAEAKRASR